MTDQVTTATIAATPKNTAPTTGPSVDSLCHPWFTATNLSYRFPIFEISATALCGTTGIFLSSTFFNIESNFIQRFIELRTQCRWIYQGFPWTSPSTLTQTESQCPKHPQTTTKMASHTKSLRNHHQFWNLHQMTPRGDTKVIPRCPESSPLWTPSHISSRISHLTTRPSFEPWNNFFSSVYDRVKGCDCETIASALAKIGSARVLCMELHQEQGNLRGLHIEWFSNSRMFRGFGGGMVLQGFPQMGMSNHVTPIHPVYNWKIDDLFSGWHCRHRDTMVFCRVLEGPEYFKINKNINLPCPSQRDPPSLQRVPRWQWWEIADRSRRRWENSAGWWSARHPSCQCQGYQPTPNAWHHGTTMAVRMAGWAQAGWTPNPSFAEWFVKTCRGTVTSWLWLAFRCFRFEVLSHFSKMEPCLA